MKVIIPVAGSGTRLQPHTFSVPKPLLRVAGKTILDYVLAPLKAVQVDEIVFVVGSMGDRIKEHVAENYDYATRYVRQEKLLGLGYAMNLAVKEMDNGPVLIILGDTIVECDLAKFTGSGENVLGLRQVDDPQRFGIAEIEGDHIKGVEEKSLNPKTNLALIGLYYFSNAQLLKETLGSHIESGHLTEGEVQFTDALQGMISRGTKFVPYEVQQWYDCGTKATLLETNAHFLRRLDPPKTTDNSLVIPPVFVAPTARLENSIVGPNVSVAAGATIENSIISNSIVNRDASIRNVILERSLVGPKAHVRGGIQSINVGDSSEIEIS
jgi:glucose-1-phosphate thymidylyltransferase